MPPFLCSMSQQESLTRMSPNGTRISPESATTFPSFWSATRWIKRTEKSRPAKLLSIASAICNTSTSQPSPTTNTKSPSSGSSGLFAVTPTSIWLRLWLWCLPRFRWMLLRFRLWLTSGCRQTRLLFLTRRMRTSNDCGFIIVQICFKLVYKVYIS